MKQFQIHVYYIIGQPPKVSESDIQIQATEIARRAFTRSDVYKVKVWDTNRGPVEPNNPGAAGLILELV